MTEDTLLSPVSDAGAPLDFADDDNVTLLDIPGLLQNIIQEGKDTETSLGQLLDDLQLVTEIKAAASEAVAALREVSAQRLKEVHPDLVAVRSAKSGKAGKRSKVVPKYRHPEKPELTWSGRGKAPGWMRELETAGWKREQLAVAES